MKRLQTFGLSLIIAIQMITPAFASEVTTAGTSSTAEVPANIQATTISVTVPTQLPIWVNSSGEYTYSTDAKIENNSAGPIKVSDISMNTKNSWQLDSYTADMSKEPVGIKKIGFEINGSETVQGSNTLSNVATNFSAIMAGGSQSLDYSAKIPSQAEAIDNLSIGDIVFTVDWYTGGNSTAESESGLLALDKETIQMLPGTKEEIRVTYQETPSLVALMALENKVTWKSSNESIASVTDGVVEAQSTGNAVITATAGELVASCNVIVNEEWVPITAISFSKHSTTIANGSSETVLVLYNPGKFSGTTDLTVTSNNDLVASVAPADVDGVTAADGPTAIAITATGPGKATITASATTDTGTVTDNIIVNVTEPLIGLEIAGESSVKVGETIQLTANKIPANTTDTGAVTWSSGDTSIATVDQSGVVTGVKDGTVEILATTNGIKTFIKVAIEQKVITPFIVDKSNRSKVGFKGSFNEKLNILSIFEDNGDTYEVSEISDFAFYKTDIGRVNIPGTVKSVGAHSFELCPYLKEVNIADGVVSIGSTAFQNCPWLETLTMPDSVTEIGTQAISINGKLTSIKLSKNLTEITSAMLADNPALTTVEMFEGIVKIGNSAFARDKALINITIPESVTSIGSLAFNQCKKLQTMYIPSSVIQIGSEAFGNCDDLTTITVGSQAVKELLITSGYTGNITVK